MKKILESEKNEYAHKRKQQKKMAEQLPPHPNVDSLKTKLNFDNEEEPDWDAVSDKIQLGPTKTAEKPFYEAK